MQAFLALLHRPLAALESLWRAQGGMSNRYNAVVPRSGIVILVDGLEEAGGTKGADPTLSLHLSQTHTLSHALSPSLTGLPEDRLGSIQVKNPLLLLITETLCRLPSFVRLVVTLPTRYEHSDRAL